jgi:ssDNA-binding Zn-finger/Zn-ribbon topoisomerase 1
MQHVEEAQKVASGNVCPWCGSELVRRNGKYGPFMGCSSYPKCRFTRNL